jgi:hypothetical protein
VRLRICGSVPPFPQHDLIVWCLINSGYIFVVWYVINIKLELGTFSERGCEDTSFIDLDKDLLVNFCGAKILVFHKKEFLV